MGKGKWGRGNEEGEMGKGKYEKGTGEVILGRGKKREKWKIKSYT